jgi:hypothetical protein
MNLTGIEPSDRLRSDLPARHPPAQLLFQNRKKKKKNTAAQT